MGLVLAFVGCIVSLACNVAVLYLIFHRTNIKTPTHPPFDPAAKGREIMNFFGLRNSVEQTHRTPLGTLPRTQGSWRRQRLDLQRQHNSKQKERDALKNAVKESGNLRAL